MILKKRDCWFTDAAMQLTNKRSFNHLNAHIDDLQ